MSKTFKIALIGNPNCGKTSIFNSLTGTRQHVGNYSGVTVEKKTGSFFVGEDKIELIDLPGVYSLSSSSPEEEVAYKQLISKDVDLILNVIDSSIPRRSLYLTTQLAELHIPIMLVFNMSDDAIKKGIAFDIPKLEKYFGSPIVQTVGRSSSGVKDLLTKLQETLPNLENHASPMISYGQDIDDSIEVIANKIDEENLNQYKNIPSRFFAIKLLENDLSTKKIEELKPAWQETDAQIKHLVNSHAIDDASSFIADRRYAMISGACKDSISMTGEKRRQISDKIDFFMINKILGLPIFFFIIYLTFYFTFTCAEPFMDMIENAFAFLGECLNNVWSDNFLPSLKSLVIDGIIAGVGGVIIFMPNILLLFFAISLLEDSGYMSRAAFVMDALMRKCGLQGKSFVPLVLGFGCTVPAIMATRAIESKKDRITTILVLPLMSCGARLPIYALIIPAFFAAKYQALTMFIIYLIGIIVALFASLLLKKTIFKGDGEVYLMELPPYRVPTLKSIVLHMWDRAKMYLSKAGTIILAASIILYILNTYPEKEVFSKDYEALIIKQEQVLNNNKIALEKDSLIKGADKNQIEASIEKSQNDIFELENQKQAEIMEYTISGKIGTFVEPIFKPIGFDWKLATASIGALAAKEVFVSQLGILFSQGETDENSDSLRDVLAKNYTPLQAFCIMLFSLLSIPCFATLAIIKNELNSWKYMFAEALGLFSIAYIITFIVYQAGSLLQIGTRLLG